MLDTTDCALWPDRISEIKAFNIASRRVVEFLCVLLVVRLNKLLKEHIILSELKMEVSQTLKVFHQFLVQKLGFLNTVPHAVPRPLTPRSEPFVISKSVLNLLQDAIAFHNDGTRRQSFGSD
jgi:hypothetical protein